MASKDKAAQDAAEVREAKLAQALRANLRRRKAAAPSKGLTAPNPKSEGEI